MTLPTGATLTLGEIATAIGGTVQGDASVRISGIAPLDRAGASDLTFLSAKKYVAQLAECAAGAVLITPELAASKGACANRIVIGRPQEAMLTLLPHFYRTPGRPFTGVHPTAVVDETATLDPDVTVEALAVIGPGVTLGAGCWVGSHCVLGEGVVLGAKTRLFPHVTLYAGVRIGERCAVHSGTRIGGDGFGYVYHEGVHHKVPHVGGCVIEHDVEIGTNCTIDRGSIGQTTIGAGTKIDNLVHVAHNVRIGKLCLLAAGVGIAGSTIIGDGVTFAGQVGVTGHVKVGSRAVLTAQTGVVTDVPEGETWGGFPSRPHSQAMRGYAALAKLPEFMKRVERFLKAQGVEDTKS
jgi:UDP-3-O-[3-hydroxymyristoyl] glucosamine N-acyltransferase